MVEKSLITLNAVFFASKMIGVYKNTQYVKSGVASHMRRGMDEREATFYEHGYAAHDEPVNVCMAGNCASLA